MKHDMDVMITVLENSPHEIVTEQVRKHMQLVGVNPRVVVEYGAYPTIYWINLYFDDEADRIIFELGRDRFERHLRLFKYDRNHQHT